MAQVLSHETYELPAMLLDSQISGFLEIWIPGSPEILKSRFRQIWIYGHTDLHIIELSKIMKFLQIRNADSGQTQNQHLPTPTWNTRDTTSFMITVQSRTSNSSIEFKHSIIPILFVSVEQFWGYPFYTR